MAFNWKMATGTFLSDQAKGINKRIADADEYEDEKKEEADRNKTVVGKRRALVNLAKTEINLLRKLGAKDRHINASIAAGPKGLFEFSANLQKEAQKRPSSGGSYTFSDSEIDMFIEMPEQFTTESMNPAEHYANSIGLAAPSLGSTQAAKQGLIKSAFGIGLKDAARAKLDKEAYYEGYSIMDINEIARQEAYESMDPGTYFSFKPSKDYDPTRVGPAFKDAYADAGKLSPAEQNSIDRLYPDYGEERTTATNNKIKEQQAGVVDSYAQQFGRRFLEDSSINVAGLLGDEVYTNTYLKYSSTEELERYIVDGLLDMEGIGVGTDLQVTDNAGKVVKLVLGEDNEVTSMKIDGRVVDEDDVAGLVANLQKQGLLSRESISVRKGDTVEPLVKPLPKPFVEKIMYPGEEEIGSPLRVATNRAISEGKVHYVKETDKGTGVVVGVPPRPSEGFFASIRGAAMGGATRDKILSGEIAVPKNLRPKDWDDLFGETHNRDGQPLEDFVNPKVEEVVEEVTVEETVTYTEDNPLDLKSMSAEKARKAHAKLKVGEYFINPADGSIHPKR